MGRKKKTKKDENTDFEYETEITYQCPKRGTVTEKVLVKKMKTNKEILRAQVNCKTYVPVDSLDSDTDSEVSDI
jgi:hypothetical protein